MKAWMCSLMVLALTAGCVHPVAGLFPTPAGKTPKTVYVLHRGLHTGVIVRTADIASGIWPEHEEFLRAQYLEVGWGDSDGYRFPWTARIVLRALFDSKGSVLLIHGFSGSVDDEYAGIAKEIVAVQVSQHGLDRLCAYVQHTYAFDSSGRPIPLPSDYAWEDFFLANGHYSLVNNCNNWTARALRTAGLPIWPRCSLLAGLVMHECHRFGHVIGSTPRTSAEGPRTRRPASLGSGISPSPSASAPGR